MLTSKHQAIEFIERIEQLCKDFGYPNQDAKQEAVTLIAKLRNDGPEDAYFREKLFDLNHWIDIGFNPNKIKKHNAGLSQITSFALGSCSTAKDLIIKDWPRD